MELDRIRIKEGLTASINKVVIESLEALPDNFISWESSSDKLPIDVTYEGGYVVFHPLKLVVERITIPGGCSVTVHNDGTNFPYSDHRYIVKPFDKK